MIEIALRLRHDTANSYPEEVRLVLDLRSDGEAVALTLTHPEREVTVDAEAFYLAVKTLMASRWQPCPYCVGRLGYICSTCEDCLGSGSIRREDTS